MGMRTHILPILLVPGLLAAAEGVPAMPESIDPGFGGGTVNRPDAGRMPIVTFVPLAKDGRTLSADTVMLAIFGVESLTCQEQRDGNTVRFAYTLRTASGVEYRLDANQTQTVLNALYERRNAPRVWASREAPPIDRQELYARLTAAWAKAGGKEEAMRELAQAMGKDIQGWLAWLGGDGKGGRAGSFAGVMENNEAAVMATLKSGCFAGQVQFQGGSYQDSDQDNVGEYGFISQMSGQAKTGKFEAGQLKLVTGPLAKGLEAYGYRFACALPGAGRDLLIEWPGKPLPAVTEAGSNLREKYFAIVAWPASKEAGQRMFVLTMDGQVRVKPFDGTEPNLDAIIQRDADGENWRTDWPVFSR